MTLTSWPNRLGFNVDEHEVWIFTDGLGVRTWDQNKGHFTKTAFVADPACSPVAAVRACLERGTEIDSLPVWDASPLEVRRTITLAGIQECLN